MTHSSFNRPGAARIIDANLRKDFDLIEEVAKYIPEIRLTSYYMKELIEVSRELPAVRAVAQGTSSDALLALYRNEHDDQTLTEQDLLAALEGTPAQTPLEYWKTVTNQPTATIEDYNAAFTGPQGDSAYTVWKEAQPDGTPTAVSDYLAAIKGEPGDNSDLDDYTTTEDLNPILAEKLVVEDLSGTGRAVAPINALIDTKIEQIDDVDLSSYATTAALAEETRLRREADDGKVTKDTYDEQRALLETKAVVATVKTTADTALTNSTNNGTTLTTLSEKVMALGENPHLTEVEIEANRVAREANDTRSKNNETAIGAEVSRATQAESGLSNRITSETTNRESADEGLSTRITTAQTTANNKLNADQVDVRADGRISASIVSGAIKDLFDNREVHEDALVLEDFESARSCILSTQEQTFNSQSATAVAIDCNPTLTNPIPAGSVINLTPSVDVGNMTFVVDEVGVAGSATDRVNSVDGVITITTIVAMPSIRLIVETHDGVSRDISFTGTLTIPEGQAVVSVEAIVADYLTDNPVSGGLNNDAVDARIDLKQVPAIFQTVTDTIPQQHPGTVFNVAPGNSPFMSTPFTFSSDFADIPDGTVVKLGGTFHFGLNPSNGSLPLCSLIITQGTKHLATISNLAAQTGNDIQFLAQRGAGDIKFQPVITTTNELTQTVYPYFNVFNVYFTGAYHDILLEILNAQIALATAETKSLLNNLAGQLPIITQTVQNTNADVEALRQTVNSLVNKIDNPALDFILASTVSDATTGITTDRTTLGDSWDAEIVDHSTIENPFGVAPQEMRTTAPFDTAGLRQDWFDANITSWAVDASGSTGSTGAGPGTNSPGPYIHWEASGSGRQAATPITIQGGINRSTDVGLWLDHNGARNMEFLYNYVSRPSTVTGDAFFVAEQLDKDGTVIETRKYSDWEYQASPAQGETIDLEVGTNFVSELPGGWRRVGMDLLPECRSVKLYNIPENPTGSGDFVNDLAFYDIRISKSGLDTPSDDASSGASGEEGATGQADGMVQGLLVELETGDLNYDTDTVARVKDGAVYGVRQVAMIPAGTRTVDTFTGATPALPFSIALGTNNQHAQATRTFLPSEQIPAGTRVTAHLNIDANNRVEDDFTIDYIWGSNTEGTEVFTLGGEFLTVHMDELNGGVRIRTTETGENNLALDGGHLTGYFSFPVATPKVDATTEDVRLTEHRGKTVLGFTDSVTNPTLVIYYGNGQTFDTGVPNKDFLDHYILTTSGNPGAFRFEVGTIDDIDVNLLQSNYNAGIRYLGLFVDTPHHSQLLGLPGGMTFIKTTGEVANLETELAKSGAGGGATGNAPNGVQYARKILTGAEIVDGIVPLTALIPLFAPIVSFGVKVKTKCTESDSITVKLSKGTDVLSDVETIDLSLLEVGMGYTYLSDNAFNHELYTVIENVNTVPSEGCKIEIAVGYLPNNMFDE